MAALEAGDLVEFRQLLSSGADLNSPGRMITLSRMPQVPSFPLIWAIDVNNLDVVKLLLDSGADPNICCEYVHESQACWFHPLCYANNLRVVEKLLDAGADVDAQSRFLTGTLTALLVSACFQQPYIGELLIKRCADVNITDDEGHTALYQAIFHGHHELAARLIQVSGLGWGWGGGRGCHALNIQLSLAPGTCCPICLGILESLSRDFRNSNLAYYHHWSMVVYIYLGHEIVTDVLEIIQRHCCCDGQNFGFWFWFW